MSFTPSAVIDPTDVELRFDCSNSCGPAPVVRGLNTFLLSATEQPAPDVVALVASLNGDGIVEIPADTNAGIFSVASVNLGAGGSITVAADTGDVALPIRVLLCQTDSATGFCLADPASEVMVEMTGGVTPTFGALVLGIGAVSFDPAEHRIFVRFRDQNGVVRGTTSVSVRTE